MILIYQLVSDYWHIRLTDTFTKYLPLCDYQGSVISQKFIPILPHLIQPISCIKAKDFIHEFYHTCNFIRLKLLGLALLKEIIITPFKQRQSRFRRKRKSKSQTRSGGGAGGINNHLQGSDISKASGHQAHSYPEEQIFCILNEKMIFQTLQQATACNASTLPNHPYFVYESMQIFSFLLTTMQKQNLIENDNEYLEFVEPFIDQESSLIGKQPCQGIRLLGGGIALPSPNGAITQDSPLVDSIQYECFRCFFKIIQQMKENSLKSKFNVIFRITWLLVLRAQPYVQTQARAITVNESLNESAVEVEGIHLQEAQDNRVLMQGVQIEAINNPQLAKIHDDEGNSIFKKDIKSQLYLLGFEILKHLSQKISVDAEQDDYFQSFLNPIFQYFDSLPESWSQLQFAKLIFFIIINNQNFLFQIVQFLQLINGIKADISFEDGTQPRDWLGIFQQIVRETEGSTSIRERRSAAGASSLMNSIKVKGESSVVDYNMLDMVLDIFVRHLMQGILPDKDKQHSETLSPDHQNTHEISEMLRAKINLIEIMSECMELLQPEMNIRQFDDLRYIEGVSQIINFTSHAINIDQGILNDLEKQLRICIEIYSNLL